MKNIQSLTLMMAVMVYAAPTTTPSPEQKMNWLLIAIHGTAKALHNKGLNFTVPGVTPEDGPTCPKEFFCLAEKVLNTSTEIKEANLTGSVALNVEKLQRELFQFNILKNVSCLDTTWGRRPMNKFLRAIACCSRPGINTTKRDC